MCSKWDDAAHECKVAYNGSRWQWQWQVAVAVDHAARKRRYRYRAMVTCLLTSIPLLHCLRHPHLPLPRSWSPPPPLPRLLSCPRAAAQQHAVCAPPLKDAMFGHACFRAYSVATEPLRLGHFLYSPPHFSFVLVVPFRSSCHLLLPSPYLLRACGGSRGRCAARRRGVR